MQVKNHSKDPFSYHSTGKNKTKYLTIGALSADTSTHTATEAQIPHTLLLRVILCSPCGKQLGNKIKMHIPVNHQFHSQLQIPRPRKFQVTCQEKQIHLQKHYCNRSNGESPRCPSATEWKSELDRATGSRMKDSLTLKISHKEYV